MTFTAVGVLYLVGSLDAAEAGEIVVGTFADVPSKAFDWVDAAILFQKLSALGSKYAALLSNMSGRCQVTEIERESQY